MCAFEFCSQYASMGRTRTNTLLLGKQTNSVQYIPLPFHYRSNKFLPKSLSPGMSMPIPVGARSKAWVCGRPLAGITGFEFRRGHIYLSLVCVDVQIPCAEESYQVCMCFYLV